MLFSEFEQQDLKLYFECKSELNFNKPKVSGGVPELRTDIYKLPIKIDVNDISSTIHEIGHVYDMYSDSSPYTSEYSGDQEFAKIHDKYIQNISNYDKIIQSQYDIDLYNATLAGATDDIAKTYAVENRLEALSYASINTEVFARLFENYFHSNFNIDGSLDLFKKREPEWPDLCATQTYKENKELIDLYFDQKLPVLASKKPLTHDNFENLEKQETL